MAFLWTALSQRYPPYILEFIGTLTTQIMCYWVPATAYVLLDSAFPAFSRAHRLQPSTQTPTAAQVKACVRVALRNQILSITAQLVNLCWSLAYPASSQLLSFSSALPSATELARDLALLAFVREVWFYYSHRLLHSRLVYPRVHAIHHRFTAPIAFTSLYAHPAEHLIANVLPVALPPKLIRTHVVTSWVFLGWVLLETCTAHSGYDFFARAARMHDVHHEKFVVNYGGMGWMDWLHGTGAKQATATGKDLPGRQPKYREGFDRGYRGTD